VLRIRAPFLLAALTLATAPLSFAGCSKSAAPVQPAPDPLAGMPQPGTSSGAVRAFQWTWQQRSTDAYRRLFTSDFVFNFSNRDSAGAHWTTNDPWGRDEEEASFATLIHGGDANQPAATEITLQMDPNFTVLNDPRPGKNDSRRRKSITTQVNLTITTSDGAASNFFGSATFYLVRGDSAAVPPELGLPADSTRWYVDGWSDNTNGTGAAPARANAPQPTKSPTWGSLKSLYLPASMRP
jgi:hypothetical protein